MVPPRAPSFEVARRMADGASARTRSRLRCEHSALNHGLGSWTGPHGFPPTGRGRHHLEPALLARPLPPFLAGRLPALALLRAGTGVVADLEVAQLALEVAEALQPGRVEDAGRDRLADGARRLGTVL